MEAQNQQKIKRYGVSLLVKLGLNSNLVGYTSVKHSTKWSDPQSDKSQALISFSDVYTAFFKINIIRSVSSHIERVESYMHMESLKKLLDCVYA